MKNIQKKIKYTALGLLGPVLCLGIWSFIEPYILNKEQEVATIPNLPAGWQGKQIAQISDFQIGLWMDNTSTVRRSIEELVEAKPAAVLITGDFMYHSTPNPEQEIEKAIKLVRPLTEAKIPTYAVLGNHDYGMQSLSTPPNEELAARLKAALETIGIEVLENEAIKLRLPKASKLNSETKDSQALYLIGIGSHLANHDNVQKALAQVPQDSPRIAMMHNPESFAAFPPQTAPLAVAGHTHGGQIRVPFLPQWSWLALRKKNEAHADGWIDDYGKPGNQLYVNVGIGMSELPIRLFCPPEITLFTLEP